MKREELLAKVKTCTPDLGWEDEYPNLYGKYGRTIPGICDYWSWFTEDNISEHARRKGCHPLTDATDIELLEMWAVASDYWLHKYEQWYNDSVKKCSKLDSFIGKCERDYFGYDDRYTNETIDRIFDSVFENLDKYKKNN